MARGFGFSDPSPFSAVVNSFARARMAVKGVVIGWGSEVVLRWGSRPRLGVFALVVVMVETTMA